nr:MAG: flagella basal body P-ring formation protein FlgA [bacterium]
MGWCADAGAMVRSRTRTRGPAWRRRFLGCAALLLAWADGGSAQLAPAPGMDGDASGAVDAWTPAPGFERRVRSAIAQRWDVDPEAVRLEWGAAAPGTPPTDDAAFELVGTGAGGHWWLSVRDPVSGAMRLRVRAGVEVMEAVAARRLERGVALTEADVAHTVTVHWGAPPREGAPVGAGWVTRRVIAAGEALRPPAVAPPVLVNAGEPVQVVARRGNVELTLRARAANSAAAGERVTVRTEAGRRLQGVAVARGVVRID